MTDNITDEAIIDKAQELHDKAYDKAVYERDEANGVHANQNNPEVLIFNDGPTDDEIREKLSWVVDRFRETLKPFPRDFDPLIDKIKAIETAFGQEEDSFGDPDLGMIETSANYMAQWEGALSTNFNEKFLGPMPIIAANHGKLASYLRDHAEKMKSIYESGRQDALNIAEKGVEAIDAINDSNGKDLMIALAVLIAAGTLAGPALGVASAPLAVQLANAAVIAGSVLGGPFVEKGEEVPLGGDTVEEVMNNVRDALDASAKRIFEEEGYLLDALKKSEGEVFPQTSGNLDGHTALLPQQPKVFTATDEELTAGLVQFDSEDGTDGGGDRGSYVGDDPPDNFEGSVFVPPEKKAATG